MNHMDLFHKIIITMLTWLMGLVVLLATLELIYLIALDILSPPYVLLDISELLDIFGYFLLILIGIGFIIVSLAAGYYLVKKSQEETICKKL